MIPTFIRSYEASADVAGYLVVAFSDAANSSKVAAASTATGPILGTSDPMGASAGDMLDVHSGGVSPVTLGGTVAAGDPLTADANGKAVKAVASAGNTVRVFGYATQPGVAGDIIDYQWAPALIVT